VRDYLAAAFRQMSIRHVVSILYRQPINASNPR
jgi:hypothetical protein